MTNKKIKQFKISLNVKHIDILNKFRNAIINVEGSYYGNFQDYLLEAISYYTDKLIHSPEELGTVRNKKMCVTVTDKEVTAFLSRFEHTIPFIDQTGMKEEAFMKLLENFFKSKSEKTLRDKRNKILRAKGWTLIKLPGIRPRVIMSKKSQLYDSIYRFDIQNQQKGIRATSEEMRVLNYLKKEILEI